MSTALYDRWYKSRAFGNKGLLGGLLAFTFLGPIPQSGAFPLTSDGSVCGQQSVFLTSDSNFAQEYSKLLKVRFPKSPPYLAMQFRGLKTINTKLNDGGVSGQFVSLVHQFFFQYSLAEVLRQQHQINLQKISTPIVNMSLFRLNLNGRSMNEANHLARTVNDMAVQLVNDYFLYPRGNAAKLLDMYFTNSKDLMFEPRFAENQKLQPLSEEKLRLLRSKLTQIHAENPNTVNSWFTAGVGHTAPDAIFVNKSMAIIKEEGGNSEFTFDPKSLALILEKASATRKSIPWLFKNQTDAQLIEIFAEMRKNQVAKEYSDLTPELHRLFSTAYTAEFKEPLPPLEFAKSYRALSNYMIYINVLDYLPSGQYVPDPSARSRFEKLENPVGIGFFDVKGLGAANYLLMHHTSQRLEPLLNSIIKDIEYLSTLDEKSAVYARRRNGVLSNILAFDNIRKNILQPTNSELISIRQKIHQIFLKQGLNANEFVIWSSGDDIFFVHNNKKVNHRELFITVKNALGNSVRGGFANTGGQLKISLDVARANVGQGAEIIKKIEALQLNYSIVTETSLINPHIMKLYRLDGKQVDPNTFQLLKDEYAELQFEHGF